MSRSCATWCSGWPACPTTGAAPTRTTRCAGAPSLLWPLGTRTGLSHTAHPKRPPSWQDGRWRQGRAMGQLSPRWHGALQGVPRAGTSRWGSPWLGTPASPSASNPECLPQIFDEVRNLLDNTTADHPQNLRASLEDAGSSQGRRAQRGHVPQQPSQPLPTGIPGHPCLSSTVPAEPNPRAACPRCCGTRRESLGFKIARLWPPPVGGSWGRPRAFGGSLLCF